MQDEYKPCDDWRPIGFNERDGITLSLNFGSALAFPEGPERTALVWVRRDRGDTLIDKLWCEINFDKKVASLLGTMDEKGFHLKNNPIDEAIEENSIADRIYQALEWMVSHPVRDLPNTN